MNWKMTAKTILVQLHHKIQTFAAVNRHLVLVAQDDLLDCLRANFDFNHVAGPTLGDAMHFHAYSFLAEQGGYVLKLKHRTDAAGVAACLGLKAEPTLELGQIVAQIERKLSHATLLEVR